MKLNHEQKIHEAASNKPGRYAMHHVRVRLDASTGKPQLEATDGRILAVVPCEPSEGDGFAGGELLPRELFVEALKGKKTEERTMILVGAIAQVKRTDPKGGETHHQAELGEGEFPRLDQVLPEESDTDISFTFDTDRLLRIIKATGAAAITLRIPSEESRVLGKDPESTIGNQVRGPVKVIARSAQGSDSYRRNGAFGVIMPITMDSPKD